MIVLFPSTIPLGLAISKPDNGGICRVRTGFVLVLSRFFLLVVWPRF